MRRLLSGFVALAVAVGLPGTAFAGGFEFPGAGTRPMGRGGAMVARADSPMTLFYSPAGLADLGGAQLSLDASIAFMGACAQRSGTGVEHFRAANSGDAEVTPFGTVGMFDDPAATYLGESYPESCNEGPPGPGANLIGTFKPHNRVGVGIGLLTPLAVGHLIYGNGDGTIDTPRGPRPAPLRYGLNEAQVLLFFPTVGVGVRATDWMRLGLSFGWGMGIFKFVNDTVAIPGENPEQDILSEVHASDFFVPQLNVSAHFVPHDALDLVLGFRWTDDVGASGDTDLTYGHLGTGMGPDSTVRTTTTFPDVSLDAPQPWQLYFGARFANRITPRPNDARAIERLSRRVEDSMSNERWDIELDVVYEINSRVDDFVVTFPEMRAGLGTVEFDRGTMETGSIIIPSPVRIPHRWKDQLSLRLGGDYNIIPGLLAARLGGSFETRGVTPEVMGVDFFPVMRIGIHAGMTVRLGRLDLSLAYSHFFHESITVPQGAGYANNCPGMSGPGEAALHQIAATGSATNEGCVINAGTYSSHLNALALSGNYHF